MVKFKFLAFDSSDNHGILVRHGLRHGHSIKFCGGPKKNFVHNRGPGQFWDLQRKRYVNNHRLTHRSVWVQYRTTIWCVIRCFWCSYIAYWFKSTVPQSLCVFLTDFDLERKLKHPCFLALSSQIHRTSCTPPGAIQKPSAARTWPASHLLNSSA